MRQRNDQIDSCPSTTVHSLHDSIVDDADKKTSQATVSWYVVKHPLCFTSVWSHLSTLGDLDADEADLDLGRSLCRLGEGDRCLLPSLLMLLLRLLAFDLARRGGGELLRLAPGLLRDRGDGLLEMDLE
jgi:hypothetical protein